MVDTWRYPRNWREISRRIRERDEQRCRWCGAGAALFDLTTGRRVSLTTMHLDGDPMNCENWNLVTACRSCHAAYDALQVTAARSAARRWTRMDAGQLELLPELP
jgi:5-methylcytosine-specific restriction endonuclease McrA